MQKWRPGNILVFHTIFFLYSHPHNQRLPTVHSWGVACGKVLENAALEKKELGEEGDEKGREKGVLGTEVRVHPDTI